MELLTRAFYDRDTVQVARELLGCQLVRVLPGGERLVCAITETEAYVGRMDKACHAYNYKRTPRTQTLFAPPGTVYLYLIYGMHHCLNFVTEPEGEPCAVLIRGGQVRQAGDIIADNRFGCKMDNLSPAQRAHLLDGPGKLCQALALTRAENGISLAGEDLFVCQSLADLGLTPPEEDLCPPVIHTGERIGIADRASMRETDRDEANDGIALEGAAEQYVSMEPGDVLIAFPEDAHQVKVESGGSCQVQKAVVKVLL